MAIIDFTILAGTPLDGWVGIQWEALTGSDTGNPMAYSSYADKTVQIFGTIDPSFPVTIEGSLDSRVVSDPDNAVWEVLTDNLGNQLSFVDNGLRLLVEAPRFIRPNGGGGTTDVTVIIGANKS